MKWACRVFLFFFIAALRLYRIFLPAQRILTILQRDFSFKEYMENKSLVPRPRCKPENTANTFLKSVLLHFK